MSTETLSVPLALVASLGVEHWRLNAWAEQHRLMSHPAAAQARLALRRIGDVLRACEIEVQGMDGRRFDAGLAVRVIDVVDDPTMPDGDAVIDETLSPLVLLRGQVVKEAEVVTRRGTGK